MDQIIRYQEIGRLAFPLIISQSVILLGGIIDLAFIGSYGTEAIAAVSIANALCATLFNFLEGFRIGTTVLIAKASAAKDKEKATAVVNTGLFLALVIGILLLLAAPSISNVVYRIVDNDQITHHGLEYLKIWLWTVPIILSSHVLVGLFRGLRDTATPLYSTLTVCLLNIMFAYLFVYGGFGFPSLGVKGSAWATMAANLVGLLLTVYLAVTRTLTSEYINLKQPFLKQVPEYITLAVDVGLNTGFTLLALLGFVYIIKQLGVAALAVHQITLQIFNFAYLPATGFLITASIIVPQLLEHHQRHLVMPTVIRICKMSFGTIFMTSGLLYICASSISRFFSPADPIVANCCGQYT